MGSSWAILKINPELPRQGSPARASLRTCRKGVALYVWSNFHRTARQKTSNASGAVMMSNTCLMGPRMPRVCGKTERCRELRRGFPREALRPRAHIRRVRRTPLPSLAAPVPLPFRAQPSLVTSRAGGIFHRADPGRLFGVGRPGSLLYRWTRRALTRR